ncbi:MAG: hypothetical protein EBZ26_02580, partial [Flavobacteriia bacterium]|nr:hypothetical protein [Flavobacteriia bacterium]
MRHAVLAIVIVFLAGCRNNDQPIENFPPETQLQVDTIIRSGDLRLGTNVQLHWYGTDRDGFIDGYNVAVNGTSTFTTATDSLFSFSIDAGVDTADILVEIAAVDNEGAVDESPASLVVPIKNAAPEVSLDPDGFLPDSAFIVATLDWRASDADGDETIELVEIKLNNGNWFSIGTQPSLLSFALNGDGTVDFYKNAQWTDSLSGASLTGENFLYLRAKDRAGIYSAVDTSAGFLWAPAVESTLIINGQAEYLGA